MSETTGNSNHPFFLMAAFSVMLLRWLHPPYAIPDSYELATMGECLWLEHAQWVDCAEVNLSFRPIAPAIFIGPLLTVFDSLTALVLLCTLSLFVFFYALAKLLAPHFRSSTLLLCLLSLVVLPQSQTLLSIIDARIIVLGPLFLAFSKLSTARDRILSNFIIGLCAAVAALSRPEQLLSVVFIALWIRGFSFRPLLARFIGLGFPLICWITYLSIKAKQLVLTPRHWESWLLMQNELPLRWRQQLYGMGIWNPPLREEAMTFDAPKIDAGLSILDAYSWLYTHIFNTPLIVLSIGIIIGAKLLFRFKNPIKFSWVLLIVMLPSLIATLFPQARDPLFPDSNLIPFILCIGVLGLAGYALRAKALLQENKHVVPVILLMGLLGLTGLTPKQNSLPQIDKTEAGRAFISAQRERSKGIVLSSFESAPLLYYTPQHWQQLPSPFEERPESTHLIYSHLDVNQMLPEPQIKNKKSTLLEVFTGAGDNSWILLYQLEPETH